MRNLEMVERIERAPARTPSRFVVAGDSGAWADPTADAIFSQLVAQIAALDPPPLFFANLGDFAGPGTPERHDRYLRLVEALGVPNICVVGNHDLDDAGARETFGRVHGPGHFTFAHGDVRFVVIDDAPGEVGEIVVDGETAGPRAEELEFLERALSETAEPVRVVLMHMPPYLDGHYAPHADWGFRHREDEFLRIVHDRGVQLVCCAHGLAYDSCTRDGTRFVMSGGWGSGLCSHFRGICTEGDGHPEDRGALFHAVEITVSGDARISQRLIQAFA